MRKTLFIAGFGPIILLAVALALWRLWPSPPPEQARIVELAGHRLRFAATYLRDGDPNAADHVDLTVLAPDFTPAAVNPQRLPAAGEPAQKGRAQIFIALTPATKFDGPKTEGKAAAPAERFAPYLAAEAQVADGGLLRRRFEDSSPYAGEDLYLAPPDGEEFYARCLRPRIPADGLPDTCLGEFHVEGILAQIRFDPVWLGEWPSLRANTLALVRGAILP
jgi:hypothetical protein